MNERRFSNSYAEFVLQKYVVYIYKNQEYFLDNERMPEIIYLP